MYRLTARDPVLGNAARGALVALCALLLVAPLGDALAMTFDSVLALGAATVSGALALAAFFAGGFASTHDPARPSQAALTGACVWCVTALVILHLRALGYELSGFALPFGDGATEALLPFSRNQAWTQVAGNALLLLATWAGAWTGSHVGVGRATLRFATP